MLDIRSGESLITGRLLQRSAISALPTDAIDWSGLSEAYTGHSLQLEGAV